MGSSGGRKRPRTVKRAELRRILRACREDPNPARGLRDAALVAVFAGAGLSRVEAVALDREDLDLRARRLRVRGLRPREIPLGRGPTAALRRWVEFRGSAPGPLFRRADRSGRSRSRDRMSGYGARVALQRRCEAAGIRDAGPEAIREVYVRALIEAGADVVAVAGLLGVEPQTASRFFGRARRSAPRVEVPIP